MADYYYILKVIDCRGKSDPGKNPARRARTKNTKNSSGNWVLRFSDLNSTAASSKVRFLGEVQDQLSRAPGMVKYLDLNALLAALTNSATTTNDGVTTVGPWSQRIGKRFLRYEIGVSTSSYGNAEVNCTAHDLE
jgi:hypothetical protein